MRFAGVQLVVLLGALCPGSHSQQSGSLLLSTATSSAVKSSSSIIIVASTTSPLNGSLVRATSSSAAFPVTSSPLSSSLESSPTPITPTVSLILSQTSSSLFTRNISTTEFLFTPTTSPVFSLSVESTVLTASGTSSRPAPTGQPTEQPTDSSTSFIEFVESNPVAFSVVGASILLVVIMCGCLGLTFACRKRLRNMRQTRGDRILDQAGDVWIVNQNATLRSDSLSPGQSAQHPAAAAALQRPADRAFILSNPQAVSQSSLLQYHEIPDLVSSPALPTLSPMTSSSGLITSPLPIGRNTSTTQLLPASPNVLNPSAPPRYHI